MSEVYFKIIKYGLVREVGRKKNENTLDMGLLKLGDRYMKVYYTIFSTFI